MVAAVGFTPARPSAVARPVMFWRGSPSLMVADASASPITIAIAAAAHQSARPFASVQQALAPKTAASNSGVTTALGFGRYRRRRLDIDGFALLCRKVFFGVFRAEQSIRAFSDEKAPTLLPGSVTRYEGNTWPET